MPFVFLIVGAVMVTAGVRGQSQNLLKLLKGDLAGTDSYLSWIVAILLIGSLGYIEALRPVSRAFLALVLIVILLKAGNPKGQGGGFFNQFETAINQIQQDSTKKTS